MTFPIRTLALVILGSAGAPAWGQVGGPGSSKSGAAVEQAPVVTPVATAVAVFPDLPNDVGRPMNARQPETHGPVRASFDGNPYGGELAPPRAHDGAIDDENPYPDRRNGIARVEDGRARAEQRLVLDVENPYALTSR